MRIGIFFGGQSREREISFAGGRTVYDNLNKNLFEAIPIFIDSVGNFIQLDWKYIYKGTIRDFYPSVGSLPASIHNFQVYVESLGKLTTIEMDEVIAQVGKKLHPSELGEVIDFAFLALHGPYGEDGNIQGLLEWYNIPYSGSGILPSAIGINKVVQKKLMLSAGFNVTQSYLIAKKDWENTTTVAPIFEKVKAAVGMPMVIKAPYQGSSIGITVLQNDTVEAFTEAVNKAFFKHIILADKWTPLSAEQRITYIKQLVDIRIGIGMPVISNGQQINHPEALLEFIEAQLATGKKEIPLESLDNEEEIIIEQFIKGKEFSCIVVQNEDGTALALPPTEIVKGNQFFDYRSKYLPGMSRKITPIQLPTPQINAIRKECEKLFTALSFNVYARLDGFINDDGQIFLNDPNTTSGMMPSSFFFHQAAEIGLNPSQFLTFLIRTSLVERIKTGKKSFLLKQLLSTLDNAIAQTIANTTKRTKVGIIMGGFSSERHISVESGRNIYEKLASSTAYEPIPIFLTGSEAQHLMYVMPINILLKDNADDIKDKVQQASFETHEVTKEIMHLAQNITQKYVGSRIEKPHSIDYAELASLVDVVFIALHGRPGEDGAVQKELEKYNIPYNGSGISSSQISINKYETNKLLRDHGILVANHTLVYKADFMKDAEKVVQEIEAKFQYPIIAKPADDGCSSAVKKIKSRAGLEAYSKIIFGIESKENSPSATVLGLGYNEEFPIKDYFLIEDLISKGDAVHFLEVTGGMLTTFKDNKVAYEVFEPSETLATGEVLSLEEKFLAGEGQNITPARLSTKSDIQLKISAEVRATLEQVARIVNIEGYCRIDAFVRIYADNRVETIVIEINSLPGMTPATCIFHQCALQGYKPYNFIDAILQFGIQRVEKNKLETSLNTL